MTDTKLEILEAAYSQGTQQADWLRDLGQRFRQSISGSISCFCYEVSSADGRRQIGRSWAEDPRVMPQIQMAFAMSPPELLDVFLGAPLQVATSREMLATAGVALESTPIPAWYAELGLSDVFVMMAMDPAGTGLVLGMGLAQPNDLPSSQRTEWVHVAAHIAAARRLRARLGGATALDRASAILNPDGRIEHIDGNEEPDIASILRDAVKQVEHARKHARSDAEALSLWQGLVDGRWSLVEQFESDARRYYVAVRNPSDTIKSRALTRREAEVVAHVASGSTTKVTAYALGLDEVTVRGYLRVAMTKLGLRSRAELVSLRAALEPAGVDSPSGPDSLRP